MLLELAWWCLAYVNAFEFIILWNAVGSFVRSFVFHELCAGGCPVGWNLKQRQYGRVYCSISVAINKQTMYH